MIKTEANIARLYVSLFLDNLFTMLDACQIPLSMLPCSSLTHFFVQQLPL